MISTKYSFTTPPLDAIAYLKDKKPELHFDYDEILHEAHHKAFTVAKVVKLDLLSDIQESLIQAQQKGQSFQSWKKDLTPTLIAKGWYGKTEVMNPATGEFKSINVNSRRLQTIYDTNMRTSYAQGRYKSQMMSSFEYLRYSSIMDSRTRPAHAAKHGIILPKTHPWWDINYPPNGWRCRCKAQAISKSMMDSRGMKVTEGVPANIADKDWAYHVGKTDTTMKAYEDKLKALKENCDNGKNARSNRPCQDKLYEVAKKEVVVDKKDFKKFFKYVNKSSFVLATLHLKYKKVLGVESNEVLITKKVLNKQKEHHPEIEWYEYLLINSMLNMSELVIQQGEDVLLHIKSFMEQEYFCVIRASKDKSKAFIASFRHTSPKDILTQKKKGKVLYEK